MNPAPAMGLMTMIYGIGQITGPMIVAYIFSTGLEIKTSFNISLYAATGAFVIGCLLYSYLIFTDRSKSN